MKARKTNENSVSVFLHLKNPFLSYFEFSFRSSRSTGVTRAVVLHVSKIFQVGDLVLFCLISVIDVFEQLLMGTLYKNIQCMLVFLQALVLVLDFPYYISMTFLTLSIAAIYADGTTLYSKCNLRPYLWRQLELASELESDLLWTGAGKGLFISILEKINLFHLTSNADAIDVKMDGSVLKNHLLRYWYCLSLLNWIRTLILSLLLKLPLKKIEAFDSFFDVSFFWGCSLSL